MPAQRKNRPGKDPLAEILDFGVDDHSIHPLRSDDVTARLQRLLKQLKEMNRRLDDIASRE